mgnify:CR=1 FL=1
MSRIEAMEDGIVPMNNKQIKMLSTELKTINQLIDDLSLLSLTESNQLTLQNSKINVSDMLIKLVDRYKLQANQGGIELKTTVPSGVLALLDEQRLRQILINLLDNAFKYGADGKQICINLSLQEHHFEIEISDNGVGMTTSQQSAVFDRFYRVQQSRSDHNSLGLGLPICMQLAELMGAKLTLKTAPNEGANFKLRFSIRS